MLMSCSTSTRPPSLRGEVATRTIRRGIPSGEGSSSSTTRAPSMSGNCPDAGPAPGAESPDTPGSTAAAPASPSSSCRGRPCTSGGGRSSMAQAAVFTLTAMPAASTVSMPSAMESMTARNRWLTACNSARWARSTVYSAARSSA